MPVNQPETLRRHFSQFAYRAAATGTLVLALFGAAWLFIGLAALGNTPYWLYLALAMAPVAMIWASVVRLRRPAPPMSEETKAISKRIRRQFGIVNAVQWTGIGVGIAILSQYGRQDLIVPFIVVVVALHFLPLARIFREPMYYYSSFVLLAWVLGCYWLPFSRQVLPPVIAIGTGGILWVIGAARLVATRKLKI